MISSVDPSSERNRELPSDEDPTLETLDYTIRFGCQVHQPFYISICISTLPMQHTTLIYKHVQYNKLCVLRKQCSDRNRNIHVTGLVYSLGTLDFTFHIGSIPLFLYVIPLT